MAIKFNALDLIIFMGEYGARFPRADLDSMCEYFEKMIRDKRILVILENKEIVAFVAFSICDDYRGFYIKDPWNYLEHKSDGEIAYIEKMVCQDYSKELRKLIEEEITRFHKNIKWTMWHRATKSDDRLIKRRIYVRNKNSKR